MKKIGKFVLPVLAVIMLSLAIYHVVKAQQTLPKPPPPVEPARTPFGHTIAGAGIVEPETENIAIGAPLPGVVLQVYVPVDKVGQIVKKGEPLFLVDDRALKAQLKYQEANLAAAQAQLDKLEAQPRPEEVPPSEAAVRAAQANLDMQRDLAERNRKLFASHSVGEEDFRQKVLAAETARQQLEQSKAQLALLKAGAWGKDKAIARASVALAEAQIAQTKTDLDRTLVRAPVDGKVLQVNVRPGEFVGAPPSQALVVLGSVAKMHVRVDIDEHDIPRAHRYFAPQFHAVASPRGDPSLKFPLTFVRVEPYVVPKKSLTGDNTERVDTRVLQVIYQVDREQPGLFVGMQLDVFIDGDASPARQEPGAPHSSPDAVR
jgi:multidrug efflux pump subunit AcrA (membrane-fusion protein)